MKLGLAGNLTRVFIGSSLTPLLLLAAMSLGLVALLTLPREEEPQISVPMVDILVSAPGLKADDAVKLVSEPLETLVKGISGVEHVYSQTRDEQVMVTARFLVGTSADAAVLRIHDKIAANRNLIPVGIPEPRVVGRGIDDVAIVTLTLSPKPSAAAHVSAADLTRIARELRSEIAKVQDVGLTYLVGEIGDAISVNPDPERLALYGVTLQQLSNKVSSANRAFSTGRILDGGEQVDLVAGETLQSPEEIGNLLVTTRDGRPVYVRDVAHIAYVADTADFAVANVTRGVDGRITRAPAITLAVAKRAGANAVTVAEAVLHRVESQKGHVIPDSIDVAVTRDYGETANEKANELLFHLALATLSIIALVWIAIGRREALVVAIVIPITILLTLFAAKVMGFTLNRVSLFALIFSIGILVDDAIVVIENISRHWGMRDGRDRKAAAIAAVAEVGNPTIVATLTVVAALLPMLFVSGMMGPYMSPIPANASAAMIFSFFVAVIVTPWLMLKVAGKGPVHSQAPHAAHGGRLGWLYQKIAAPVLATKLASWVFLAIVGIATIGSLGLFYTRDVTVKLLPFDNKSELSVTIDLPEGASVEATDAVALDVARVALSLPEVISAQTHAGTAAPFNFNGLVRHSYLRADPQLGEVQVNLSSKTVRTRSSHAIAIDLRQRLAGISVPAGTSLKVVEPPPGPPVMATLLAEVYGPTAEIRRKTGEKLEAAFRSVPFLVDIDNSWGAPARRIRASISSDDLDYFHVQESDVFDTLAILNGSSTVGYSHRGDGRLAIPIIVERPRGQKQLDEQTLTTPIPANLLPGHRGVVELGDVVRLSEERASYPVFRHNGRYAEMVTAELAGAFEAPLYGMLAVQDAIDRQDWSGLEKPIIKLHDQPDDESRPTLLWDGEWDVTWITFRDMGGAFIVALLGIYILVVAQFGSFKLPLVILTPIPLTFIGILGGHYLMHAQFTATSMIGFIALAGIIVRNSILLVDFVRHAPREVPVEGGPDEVEPEMAIVAPHAEAPTRPGAVPMRTRSLTEILIEAGAIRFKPILLTALAAMIGAVVILTDSIFQGLAISLLFGLASSTLLTVLVIPAIYRVLRT